jgi:hypothetical protein
MAAGGSAVSRSTVIAWPFLSGLKVAYSAERVLFVCQGVLGAISQALVSRAIEPVPNFQRERRRTQSAFAPEHLGDLFGETVSAGALEPNGYDDRALAPPHAD